MALTQIWGAILIVIICPIVGGLPLISWITRAFTGRNLAKIGTGNVSVSAAFYHGGQWVGILAVLSEAFKGIAAVLLARAFFGSGSEWELIALIALVLGRYLMSKGAGTTNIVWGIITHDWKVALFVFLIGGISFTVVRERSYARTGVLFLLPLIIALLHPHAIGQVLVAIALSSILGLIYQKIPDDLDLPAEQAKTDSQPVFRFFRGDRSAISLDKILDPLKVGQKSATLAKLKGYGYSVPMGWVILPGDDPEPLIEYLQPSPEEPLAVRSSAIGEDSEQASSAGQYETILNVTSQAELLDAIAVCLASYDSPSAIQYRRDRGLPDAAITVLVQKQVRGVFSGVAFSRDPMAGVGDAVIVEGLPGDAARVVSGRVTPEFYRVWGLGIGENNPLNALNSLNPPNSLNSLNPPNSLNPVNPVNPLNPDPGLEVEGTGDLPLRLVKQVAYLARSLELRDRGIPQDIEWSYDGQTLWLLQSRPITTLLPIWTRKIAAEVIPGLIRPLTWSINRPLTCGVWGEIFTLVLGNRSSGLDFNQTATLHYSRAYFNASLLGEIFLRMGLPPESLEFLTRGAKFSKPPLTSTLKNVPGLLRLIHREFNLAKDFQRDFRNILVPTLNQLASQPIEELSPARLIERIDNILEGLKCTTYYSILAPLSLALRQAVLKVKDSELDNSRTPEIASMRSLQEIANHARQLLPNQSLDRDLSLFTILSELPDGQAILEQFNQWLEKYGYLSEVGTDIAVPTWKEDPHPVQEIFIQFLTTASNLREVSKNRKWQVQMVQRRLNLKGRVTEIYSRLLAELRWGFVALEKMWLSSGLLVQEGDIFFLEFPEIRRLVVGDLRLRGQVSKLVKQRRLQLEQNRQMTIIPPLVYGNSPPSIYLNPTNQPTYQILQGIGASPGQVEGRVKILYNLQNLPQIDRQTILVVPYTDSGWAPLLARAGGLIAEVGGRLSHGAIVAREYGIPAVMDIHNATHLLRDGQQVRIDGQRGTVEIL